MRVSREIKKKLNIGLQIKNIVDKATLSDHMSTKQYHITGSSLANIKNKLLSDNKRTDELSSILWNSLIVKTISQMIFIRSILVKHFGHTVCDQLPENLRFCSEVVFANQPRCPTIELYISSGEKMPGTSIVDMLKNILSGMLDVFRTGYSECMNTPRCLADLVVLDEHGQNSNGKWDYHFHIQAPFFSFRDYEETRGFTCKVISCSPSFIGKLITLPDAEIAHFFSIFGCVLPGMNNFCISHYSRFLDTRTSIHQNDLFVKFFSAGDVHEQNNFTRKRPDDENVPVNGVIGQTRALPKLLSPDDQLSQECVLQTTEKSNNTEKAIGYLSSGISTNVLEDFREDPSLGSKRVESMPAEIFIYTNASTERFRLSQPNYHVISLVINYLVILSVAYREIKHLITTSIPQTHAITNGNTIPIKTQSVTGENGLAHKLGSSQNGSTKKISQQRSLRRLHCRLRKTIAHPLAIKSVCEGQRHYKRINSTSNSINLTPRSHYSRMMRLHYKMDVFLTLYLIAILPSSLCSICYTSSIWDLICWFYPP